MVSEDLLSSPTSDATAGSRALNARNHLAITISELQAQLKRDHARCAITAQTNAEQASRRRSRVSKRTKPSLRGRLPRNASQHHARKAKIRMVEYVEKLDVKPELQLLS